MHEKSLQGLPRQPARPRWRRWTIVSLVVLFLSSWKLYRLFNDRPHPYQYGRLGENESYSDWDDIPTSEKLHWVPCFRLQGDFLCARLTVPMDYQRPLNESADNPKVHVAMVLLPGAGHGLSTGRFSVSPLLVNPGGPGGSGAEFILSTGHAVQTVVGVSHDIIGFDPRGIGATTPRADCFVPASDAEETGYEGRNRALLHRLTWQLMAHDVGLPNSSQVALEKLSRRATALATLCKEHSAESGGFEYMGTPNVAADMKSIVSAWDAWIDEMSFETQPPEAASQSSSDVAWPPATKGKLVYWGFSYGTLLGATFASMFPDSVGRLVLDGVVDANAYTGPFWIKAMRDADMVLEKFFYYCHLAKEDCKLYRDQDSVDDVRVRYEAAMESLRNEPMVVISPVTNLPVIVMESDVRSVIFVSLYFPMSSFPVLALVLDIIYRGDDLSPYVISPDLSFVCKPNFKLRHYQNEASAAIGCLDRLYKVNQTLPALEDQMRQVAKWTSFADVWTALMLSCEDWGFEAKFPSPNWDENLSNPDAINTAFPILFIGNTHDPVTPLHSAVKMSQRFANAGLIEVETEGHTTLATVSICEIVKLRLYLDAGVVPAHPIVDEAAMSNGQLKGEWVKCKPDEHPWKRFGTDDEDAGDGFQGMSVEEMEMLQGWKHVQQSSDEVLRHINLPTKLRLNGCHMSN